MTIARVAASIVPAAGPITGAARPIAGATPWMTGAARAIAGAFAAIGAALPSVVADTPPIDRRVRAIVAGLRKSLRTLWPLDAVALPIAGMTASIRRVARKNSRVVWPITGALPAMRSHSSNIGGEGSVFKYRCHYWNGHIPDLGAPISLKILARFLFTARRSAIGAASW